ncbi:MAG TPA: hypothetical protein VLC12_03635 [Terriglobales bacterium]|nr:hypothetical protein [Terriglobales bacterium]
MSVNKSKKGEKLSSPHRKKAPHPGSQAAAPQPVPYQPSRDFERELQDHFAAEARKKVEEAAENIFGSVLARHGWARNERGQVEYVGGEGA